MIEFPNKLNSTSSMLASDVHHFSYPYTILRLQLQVKAVREEEEEKKKIQANHEMVDVLQKQMAAIEAHRRMETALVEEEAQLLVSPVKSKH